jgi:hypothetical protein
MIGAAAAAAGDGREVVSRSLVYILFTLYGIDLILLTSLS